MDRPSYPSFRLSISTSSTQIGSIQRTPKKSTTPTTHSAIRTLHSRRSRGTRNLPRHQQLRICTRRTCSDSVPSPGTQDETSQWLRKHQRPKTMPSTTTWQLRYMDESNDAKRKLAPGWIMGSQRQHETLRKHHHQQIIPRVTTKFRSTTITTMVSKTTQNCTEMGTQGESTTIPTTKRRLLQRIGAEP